jgi:4-aminobutyrate aminotransferase/(S)-3-amino-2-methylpropionate transaminase
MSSDVFSKDEKYRILSFTKLEPIAVVGGHGATLRDIEGREYLDCYAGISVVNAGHCPPKVVKAVQDQAEKLIHYGPYVYHNPIVTDLAEKLAAIAPKGLMKTFFGNSGAEANETAVKLAKKFTKKQEIVALECSFHGRTVGTLSMTGQSKRKRYDMGPYLSGVSFNTAAYCYRCPFEKEYPECGVLCARRLEDIINYHSSDDVAALIAEPVMGEGGIIVPPPEYFRIIKKILDEHGSLLIVDEVQSGYGRTGKMFGIDHYDVIPDIMTLGKGIAAGFPLSACIARSDVGDSLQPGDHLSTFGGNPICCAAAIANLDIFDEEKLVEASAKKGEYLLKRFKELQMKHPLIGDVRGKGLMIGVELVKDRKTKTPGTDETIKLRESMRKRGILVGTGGVKACVIRFQPPLIITMKELDNAVDVMDEELEKIEKGIM